jgi:hypothetical protein
LEAEMKFIISNKCKHFKILNNYIERNNIFFLLNNTTEVLYKTIMSVKERNKERVTEKR